MDRMVNYQTRHFCFVFKEEYGKREELVCVNDMRDEVSLDELQLVSIFTYVMEILSKESLDLLISKRGIIND